jgi:hypothetical protein
LGGSGAKHERSVAPLQNNFSVFVACAFRFDIEGGTTYWSSDVATNVAFFEDMLNTATSLGTWRNFAELDWLSL